MKGGGAHACAVGAACLAITAPAFATETLTYTYDELGRLVAQSSSGTVNNGQVVTISLDPAGNRTNYCVGTVCGPAATISIGNASVTEGGTLSFTVTRSGNTSNAVSASYATANGTAAAPGDYTAKSGTVSFTSGQTTNSVTVTTIDDSLAESAETMTVTLSSPSSGATIGTAVGTGTINDNDSTIALTDNSLQVLSQHASVYACYIGSFYDPYVGYYDWEYCELSSNGVDVYNKYASPTLDPGYSLPVQKRLEVAPAYYGTGVSP